MVLAVMFALLVLFAIVSIVASAEDSSQASDPRDNPLLWATLARR